MGGLPNYMPYEPICMHCEEGALTGDSSCGDGGRDAAARVRADRTAHQSAVLALLHSEASKRSSGRSLAWLLEHGVCCARSGGAAPSGSGAEGGISACAPAQPGVAGHHAPLVHTHAISQLAEWTGLVELLRQLQEQPPREQQPAPASSDLHGSPWDRQVDASLHLFDLALRLTTLDPARRMHAEEALAHLAMAADSSEEDGTLSRQIAWAVAAANTVRSELFNK